MFYSEKLLSKTGPLAKVWLASNRERKLSKSQVLQSNIEKDIGAIVDQGEAPLALRLSGQLMLGVVRIYGKKAKYLQDDCHETLLKIRMTFRNTGNHDLPANATVGLDLNLPDLLTVEDLFPSMDFAYPLTQQPAIEASARDYDEDWTSTLNPLQNTQSRLSPEDRLIVNDEDLGLDFGDGNDFEPDDTAISVQRGRNAPAERALEDEIMGGEKIYNDDDLVLDLGDNEDVPMPIEPNAVRDVDMIDAEDDGIVLGGDEEQLRQRDGSPLSEVGSQAMRDLDQTFAQQDEDVTEIAVQQRQRSRKFKPLEPDVETVLHNRQIKAQSEDRSKILKAPSFLPRDPMLLALIEMQKNGDFVTNAMNDGQSKHWAPELQGLLSFDAVYRSGHKRKRDSGIAGLSEDEHSEKSPRLDLEDEVDEGVDTGDTRDRSAISDHFDDGVQPIRSDPALADMVQGEDEEGIYADGGFDDTTMPLLHPAESGAVSLGTKQAVHLLREKFGGQETDGSPSSQSKKSVLLQDLVPERHTSKEDATKMFFEVLVLATKDAIKVEQGEKEIGLPLRIRGKRGLWGSWAETTQDDDEMMTAQVGVVA